MRRSKVIAAMSSLTAAAAKVSSIIFLTTGVAQSVYSQAIDTTRSVVSPGVKQGLDSPARTSPAQEGDQPTPAVSTDVNVNIRNEVKPEQTLTDKDDRLNHSIDPKTEAMPTTGQD